MLLISRLNGWPVPSPADASPSSSRMSTHGSGPRWVATPSLWWTRTTYSLLVSRRTQIKLELTQVIGQRLLDVVLDPVAQPWVLGLPLRQPGGDVAPHLGNVAPVVEPAQLLQAIVVHLARHVVERVAQEMHGAALPGGLRENLADRRLQTLVIVGDDELDAGEPTRLQAGQEIAPARPALAVRQLDRQDLAPAVLVNRHRHQHSLADNDPGLAHLLVARIQDQIGIALVEPAFCERLQTLVERLVDRADRRGRKVVAA